MDQLRATFIVGPQSSVTAQETFTDRVEEVEAFQKAVRALQQVRTETAGRLGVDLSLPRGNVLVFYGIGGIGKTTLSRQLERRYASGALAVRLPKKRMSARMDFGEGGQLDLESLLLQIRGELSRIRARWAAFDTAFALYWSRTHPGESLPEFIRRNSRLRRQSDQGDLAEQLQSTFVHVLAEIGMSWTPSRLAVRLATLTHDRLSRSATYRRLTNTCPFFETIVTADPSVELLSYLPSLLAWEMDNLDRNEAVPVVVFLDTFEAVSGPGSRGLERLIQRFIFLLPGVLFVLTGRNRLDWAEANLASGLDYIGRSRWPNLHLESLTEPRQHLVGALSPDDCDAYLRNVLTDGDGSPAIEPPIRAEIVAASAGLPLYLDLSVTQYLEFAAVGRPATPESFGGPLSSIVARIMRDLDTQERNILRGVSLLDCFDLDLAGAASGSPDAKIARFINSSLVMHTSGQTWPYMLHTQLRRTVQEADHELSDSWSEREWRLCAERISAHLGQVCERARRERDLAVVTACFSQAVRLSMRYGPVPPWILDAAQFLADCGLWRVLDVRASAQVADSSPAAPLLHGLKGIALRRQGSLEDSITQFDAALCSSVIDDHVREIMRLHRAHSVRNSGRYAEAYTEYAEIAGAPGPYTDRATLQLADLDLLGGRFGSALRILAALPEQSPDAAGEALRIKGHVHRVNADFQTAELIYRRALDLGREVESPALEGKALTNLAETLCWTDPQLGGRLAEEAVEFNAQLGNQLEVLKAYAAKAVAADDPAAVDEALRLAEASKYRAGEIFARVSRMLYQARAGEPAVLESAARIAEITAEIGVYHFWNEVVGWWSAAAGLGPEPAPNADWLDGAEVTRSRWIGVLHGTRGAS